MTGREDNMYIAEEITLAILPVCCCSTCRLWRRDNNEEDGGDDDGTRGHVAKESTLAILYLSVVVVFCCYLFVVSHMLAPGRPGLYPTEWKTKKKGSKVLAI